MPNEPLDYHRGPRPKSPIPAILNQIASGISLALLSIFLGYLLVYVTQRVILSYLPMTLILLFLIKMTRRDRRRGEPTGLLLTSYLAFIFLTTIFGMILLVARRHP